MPATLSAEGPDERAERTQRSVPDAQRDVLSPVVDVRTSPAFVDDHCANCLDPLPPGSEALFCSAWCQETTKHVRWIRRKVRDARATQDDAVFHAITTRVHFLDGGGYNRLGRVVKRDDRNAILAAANGRCAVCGAPGSDVDHKSGSGNGTANLQVLCAGCHTEKTRKTLGLPQVATEGDGVPWLGTLPPLLQEWWRTRIEVPTPLLLADDDTRWPDQYRRLKAEHCRRLNPAKKTRTRPNRARTALVFTATAVPPVEDGG